MASTKVALLLLGCFALAAVASAQKPQKPDGGFWAARGWNPVPKGSIVNAPKPPQAPKVPRVKPDIIVNKTMPRLFAPPQAPAVPRFTKPVFNKIRASPSPKPAKVEIIKVQEPKIIDNSVPLKNKEPFPFPDFNKIRASPSPKPAKVQIIKVQEPKIIDNSVPLKNKEPFPQPQFRKVFASPSPKPMDKPDKIIEAPIRDITRAPPKVTKGFIDPPGKNVVVQPKNPNGPNGVVKPPKN